MTNLASKDTRVSRAPGIKYIKFLYQVNNAGGGKPIRLLDCTIDDLESMLEVNTKAPFNITQKALPAITKSKGESLFLF